MTPIDAPETPLTVKSLEFTFCTGSSNVTRKTRESALVAAVAGVWRTMEATRGAVASATLGASNAKLSKKPLSNPFAVVPVMMT